MSVKLYTLTGIDTAVKMLRPGARWEIYNNRFTVWEDPRPCPSMEEVMETVEKIKAFEDSINTIWLPDQLNELGVREEALKEYLPDAN